MQSKIANKVLAAILSVSLIFQMVMPVVYAAEENLIQETKTITAFAELPEDVKSKTVPVGTEEIEILTCLPETVTATVASAVYGETQPKIGDVALDVTWESDKTFPSETADIFTCTARLTDGSYTLGEGVSLVQIKVHMDDSLNSAEGLDTTVGQATGALEAPAEHFTVHTAARMLTSSNITPTVDVGSKDIYANGTPITIEAGTLKDGVRNSKIKYNNGTSDVYLDLNPNEVGIQEEVDLSQYGIYGGSNPSDKYAVENTFITMTGGKVCNIYGGGSVTGEKTALITVPVGVKDGGVYQCFV